MAITNYSQSVYSAGVDPAGPNPRGATLFVSSVIGNDNRGRVFFPGSSASSTSGSLQGPQTDPTKPLATLAYALTFCLAGRGDTIILLPGHTESLAASITVSVAAVQIISLGLHGERAAFTMNGFSFILSGVGTSITNIGVAAGTTANVAGVFQLSANGSSVVGCKVAVSNVTTNVFVAGAANVNVTNCDIDASTTGCSSGVLMGVFDNTRITGCNFWGTFAAAVVTCVANTNMVLQGNIFRQFSAGVKPVINGVVTATSGLVTDNRFQSVAATSAAEFLDGTNVSTNILVIYVQNFGFKGKAGPSSGILIPAVGTIP